MSRHPYYIYALNCLTPHTKKKSVHHDPSKINLLYEDSQIILELAEARFFWKKALSKGEKIVFVWDTFSLGYFMPKKSHKKLESKKDYVLLVGSGF